MEVWQKIALLALSQDEMNGYHSVSYLFDSSHLEWPVGAMKLVVEE